jgi:ATP-dependent exoDNAse (exonuclease V) alpha subunit
VVTLDPTIVELAYCLTIYRAQGSRYDYVFVVMPTGIRAGYLEDPRVQEVARTRGREQTYLLVC